MKKIPFFRQQNNYYCGPAAIQMVLGSFDIRAGQKKLAALAKTNRKTGTSVAGLVHALRSYKLPVRAHNHSTVGELRQALGRGELVVVCYTEPVWEWGHYAIVKKIIGKRIYLLDPDSLTGITSIFTAEFKHRWNDPVHTKTIQWAAFVSQPKSQKRR